MRIYQSSDGKWIFFDGTNKHYYDTELEARSAMGKAKMVNEVLDVVKMLVEPMEKAGAYRVHINKAKVSGV